MSRASMIITALGLRHREGGPSWLGLFAIIAIVGTVFLAVWAGAPVVRSLAAPAGGTALPPEAEQADKFKAAMEKYVKQVDGRSLFVRPLPPPRIVDRPSGPSAPIVPPKPSRYGGPSLIAMVNDTAWFNGDLKLTVGGPTRSGVRLIALDPPWTARVEWEGVEFEVDLFQRNKVVGFKDVKSGSPDFSYSASVVPKPAPAAPRLTGGPPEVVAGGVLLTPPPPPEPPPQEEPPPPPAPDPASESPRRPRGEPPSEPDPQGPAADPPPANNPDPEKK